MVGKAVKGHLVSEGVTLRFDDLRVAKGACEDLQLAFKEVNYATLGASAAFVTAASYKLLIEDLGYGDTLDAGEGNLYVCINRDGLGLTTETLRNMALEEAGRFGSVYAFKKMGDSPQRIILRIEFYSVRAADSLHVVYANGANCSSNAACYIITAKTFDKAVSIAMHRNGPAHTDAPGLNNGVGLRPVAQNIEPASAPVGVQAAIGGPLTPLRGPRNDCGPVQPLAHGVNFTSTFYGAGAKAGHPVDPTFQAHAFDTSPFRPMPYDHLLDARTYGRRRFSNHTNPVDPHKIMRGEDVRTTVMLRNVPNKMDVHELKNIIDATSYGKYDFSYLRIDFKNACNVGYAFINFVRPEFIIAFLQTYQNKPWNLYNSDKIAEISYATRQGTHCLIDAFRNSCVMEEHPDHRPKLWFTEDDGEHVTGKEKPFPTPNNMTKLQRSRANAETVGLFPPRGARPFAQFAEHGNSLFDNGTPQALLYAQRAAGLGMPYQPSGSSNSSTYSGTQYGMQPFANGNQSMVNQLYARAPPSVNGGLSRFRGGYSAYNDFPNNYAYRGGQPGAFGQAALLGHNNGYGAPSMLNHAAVKPSGLQFDAFAQMCRRVSNKENSSEANETVGDNAENDNATLGATSNTYGSIGSRFPTGAPGSGSFY